MRWHRYRTGRTLERWGFPLRVAESSKAILALEGGVVAIFDSTQGGNNSGFCYPACLGVPGKHAFIITWLRNAIARNHLSQFLPARRSALLAPTHRLELVGQQSFFS